MDLIAGILDNAERLTVIGLLFLDLVVVVVGVQRRWWIPGYLHEQRVTELQDRLRVMTDDRDKWQGLAIRGTDLVEAAVGGIRHAQKKKDGSA